MYTFNMTGEFEQWLSTVSDVRLAANIMRRIAQATLGNFGDFQSVGNGVFEMRIHYGAGWRMYYAQEGRYVYLLLHAGSKARQHNDILRAKALWEAIKRESNTAKKEGTQNEP